MAKKEFLCEDLAGESCGLKRVLDTIGGKWKIMILCVIDRGGTVRYGDDNEIFVGMSYGRTKPYSEQTAGIIDEEVKAIIDKAYADCTEILTEHDDKLEQVAQFLLENETMSGRQFNACMKGEPIPENEADSIFDHFAEMEQAESEQPAEPEQPVAEEDPDKDE